MPKSLKMLETWFAEVCGGRMPKSLKMLAEVCGGMRCFAAAENPSLEEGSPRADTNKIWKELAS